jgi:peptidoglycan/xylan/chitin deacetylase (PgdA/CDA1 family)
VPPRKRLLVIVAVLAAGALLAVGVAWARAGHVASGSALIGGTVVLGLAALHVFWPPFDLGGRSLRRGARRERRVALTFDDGPSDDTPAVLDALDRAEVHATFFVLGEAAERRPDLVREVARRGHEVALHGHTHARLALAGPRTVASEIDRGRDAIRRTGVKPAPFFRAPHGWKGPFLGPALRARELRLVAWTRGAWDTERCGPDRIADRASHRPRPGEIVLLHDGCGTRGIDPRRDHTAAAVPEIVRRWRAAGFAVVPVGVLAESAPTRARAWPRIAGLAVVAGVGAAALAQVDLRAVAASLASASPGLLAVAAGANLVSLAAHAARWRAVVLAPEGRVRYRDALVAIVAGFAAGLALPGRGGDLLRAHLLARRAGVSTASVLAASALDYLVGMVAFVIALGALAAAAPLPSWGLRALGVIAALAAAAGVAAWLLRPGRPAAPPRAQAQPDEAGRAPLERSGGSASGLVARLRGGLAALHDAGALATALAWALVGWAAEWAVALATLAALGLPATPVVAALAVLAASAAAAVAVAPGNAGSFEVATALAVAGAGAPGDAALAFALAFHAAHVVPVALIGGAMLLREGIAREALARERP